MSTRYSNGPQQGNGFCGYIVGQHVVLLTDAVTKSDREVMARYVVRSNLTFPKPGIVYTVRSVELAGGVPAILLQEIKNRALLLFGEFREVPFPARWFRPLQKLTPETFMSTDALVKQGEPA